MPKYIQHLIDKLSTEYSVEYTEIYSGEYTYIDCFLLDGLFIQLDRIDGELSEEDMQILINSIRDMYEVLKNYG